VPKIPPTAVNVVVPGLQIVIVPVMLDGATDGLFTVTVTVAQVVVLQVPLYLIK
jgi:hypothetical protein